jgi:hypothetical protein
MKMMKRDSMSSELEELKCILTVLRLGTDNEAAAILARLRLGEPPEEVAKTLSAMASSPMATGQPPRYAIFFGHFLHHSALTTRY